MAQRASVVVGAALGAVVILLGVRSALGGEEPARHRSEPPGEEVYENLIDDEGHIPVLDRNGDRVGYAIAEEVDDGRGPNPVVYDFDGRRIGELAPGFVRDGEDPPDTPITTVEEDGDR